jgi:Rps23 Pro-64 3,4-dihydroxylase Tpa1-like proline 4-hydroxylase
MNSPVAERVSSRKDFGTLIAKRLYEEQHRLAEQFRTAGRVQYFHLDNLLDPALTHRIYSSFPSKEQMVLKKNLGQKKYVAVQMNRYSAVLEEIIYGFQEPAVVEAIGQITGITGLIPDHNLYAGGLSLMDRGNYLNPHLDNSHDKDQKLFRVLNLLFYVTPEWREEYGGNLELWQYGLEGERTTIFSRFNRLVVMHTGKHSWHSVNEVEADLPRCCVSNYYFSATPPDGNSGYHVTTFRGWPRQKLRDALMIGDNLVRTVVRRTFGEKLFTNPHVYKKSPE